MAVLVFCLITLFMIAVIVYIIVVRRKDRSEGNNAAFVASEAPWLDELIDKIDNIN
jgi:hypothetical protein